MQYGFVMPTGTAYQQLELAILAEEHGWDGVFVAELAYGIDAWTLLGAMASRTSRIRLGTMVTPLPWRRPWKVASQVLTLDQISNGRAILAVGLGAVDDFLGTTGEERDRKTRAEMMDEGIDLIRALWNGERTFSGTHYSMDFSGRTDLAETFQPVQDPIPIWVIGAWPSEKSMTRVLRCDGIVPTKRKNGAFTDPEATDIAPILSWLRERGGAGPGFDYIAEGKTSPTDPATASARVEPFRAGGATWWLEADWAIEGTAQDKYASLEARIIAGPPRS